MEQLRHQHGLKWHTLLQLYERFLDVSRLASGNTIREELQAIDKKVENAVEELMGEMLDSMLGKEPGNLLPGDDEPGDWNAQRERLAELGKSTLLRAGIEVAWLAFGRRSPFSEEEPIPPHLWNFLALDYNASKATSEEHGLEFFGLRFLVIEDLPRKLRIQAAREVSRATAAFEKNEQDTPSDMAGKAGPGPRSKGTEMVTAFREAFSTGSITKDDLANKKGVWGKVCRHLGGVEGKRGYSYQTFLQHVGPEIDKVLKIPNSEI